MISEEIVVVDENPLVLILQIPDGCTAGRWEAAESFSETFSLLKNKYPDTTFDLLPFCYEGSPQALSAIIAFAK